MTLYSVKRKVRLQDVDAAGILFFPRFLEYCHDAYFDLLLEKGMDLPKEIPNGPYILPLVHTEADFRAPLRFGDEVTITVEKAVAKTSSYTVYYTVFNNSTDAMACEAQTVHAAIERTTFKPLKELPVELRKVLGL